jgi:hypothetical protein
VRATHGKVCARPARARSRTRARVRLGHGAGLGMTRGPHSLVTAGAGEGRSGLATVVGRAKELGCDGASEPKQAVGGAPVDFGCWAGLERKGC